MIKAIVDDVLLSLDAAFEQLYEGTGRQSIALERLLRASPLQTFYSVRSVISCRILPSAFLTLTESLAADGFLLYSSFQSIALVLLLGTCLHSIHGQFTETILKRHLWRPVEFALKAG